MRDFSNWASGNLFGLFFSSYLSCWDTWLCTKGSKWPWCGGLSRPFYGLYFIVMKSDVHEMTMKGERLCRRQRLLFLAGLHSFFSQPFPQQLTTFSRSHGKHFVLLCALTSRDALCSTVLYVYCSTQQCFFCSKFKAKLSGTLKSLQILLWQTRTVDTVQIIINALEAREVPRELHLKASCERATKKANQSRKSFVYPHLVAFSYKGRSLYNATAAFLRSFLLFKIVCRN